MRYKVRDADENEGEEPVVEYWIEHEVDIHTRGRTPGRIILKARRIGEEKSFSVLSVSKNGVFLFGHIPKDLGFVLGEYGSLKSTN